MMRKSLVVAAFCTAIVSQSFGQAGSTCTQTLRLAQSTYEQGRLHELKDMLKGCLDGNEFNDEEKRQAYRLLTLSAIYLEEPESADASMLKLMQTDHFFVPNDNVDPAEFISLYNKFRNYPLFRAGIKLGPGINFPNAYSDYFIAADSPGTGKYTPKIGFSIGLVFEKDLFDGHFTLAPELNRVAMSFNERGTTFIKNGTTDEVSANSEETPKLSWIELNPLVKYNVNPKKKTGFENYIFAGPGLNFLSNVTLTDGKLDRVSGEGTNTGADVDFKGSLNKVTFTLIAGVGTRYRLGGVYVTADARVQYGLSNIVSPSSRTNLEAAMDYAYTMNDTRLTVVVLNLGIQYAYFNPKKLVK